MAPETSPPVSPASGVGSAQQPKAGAPTSAAQSLAKSAFGALGKVSSLDDVVLGNASTLKRATQSFVADKVKLMTPAELETAQALLTKYDVDGNGMFSDDEVKAIIVDLRASKKEGHIMKKIAAGLFLLVLLLTAATFAVSLAAGEALKESHVVSEELITLDGDVVQTSVASYDDTFFGLPSRSMDDLSDIERLSVIVDGRGGAPAYFNERVQASYDITSVVKATSSNAVAFYTTTGDVITIDGDDDEANITTAAGTTMPIVETLDDDDDSPTNSTGRRLFHAKWHMQPDNDEVGNKENKAVAQTCRCKSHGGTGKWKQCQEDKRLGRCGEKQQKTAAKAKSKCTGQCKQCKKACQKGQRVAGVNCWDEVSDGGKGYTCENKKFKK